MKRLLLILAALGVGAGCDSAPPPGPEPAETAPSETPPSEAAPAAWDVASDDQPGEFVKVAAVPGASSDGGCAIGIVMKKLWTEHHLPVRFRDGGFATVHVRPVDVPRAVALLREVDAGEAFDVLILEPAAGVP